jgi:drug/metabolite transporter (DMT)-like permease
MATATLVTQIMEKCGWLPAVQDHKVSFQVYLQQIVPIAALFSITLVCGNLSYLYLSVSFVQMLKACTPICVLLLSILMGLEQPNKVQLVLVGGLSLGVVVSTSGEQNFNSTGFAYKIVSIGKV